MTEEAVTHAYILVNTDLVNITLYWVNESSSAAPAVARRAATGGSTGISDAIVPMYVVIFLLAVVGNALVVVTLVRNKRMRTVTNVYLLNLVSTGMFENVVQIRLILVSLGRLRNLFWGLFLKRAATF